MRTLVLSQTEQFEKLTRITMKVKNATITHCVVHVPHVSIYEKFIRHFTPKKSIILLYCTQVSLFEIYFGVYEKANFVVPRATQGAVKHRQRISKHVYEIMWQTNTVPT